MMAFALSISAQYEKGEIDMHGGQESHSDDKKSSFRNTSMGLGIFIEDKNSTKAQNKEPKK